jgi:hypothetical protein
MHRNLNGCLDAEADFVPPDIDESNPAVCIELENLVPGKPGVVWLLYQGHAMEIGQNNSDTIVRNLSHGHEHVPNDDDFIAFARQYDHGASPKKNRKSISAQYRTCGSEHG